MGEAIIKANDPFERAAGLATDWLREAIASRKSARFAVSGGSAAKVTGLVREALGDDWSKVKLTWIDERCVPFDDADSNRGQAYRAGYLSDDAPPMLELPLWFDDDTPETAARRVRASLNRDFGDRLDVVIYGLGEDGHIASIFPGKPAMFAKETVTFVPDSPKPPSERMTLTYAVLRASAHAVLAVSGESKRDALQRVVAGDSEMPANVLPELTIVTDLDLEGA